jgi:hypothetical protein
MNRYRSKYIVAFIQLLLFMGVILNSCREKSGDGMIIFTRIDPGMQPKIAAFKPGRHGDSPFMLTGEFYSAKSAAVSVDGTKMLFSAKKDQNEKWAIWEMELRGRKARKITSFATDCYAPAYLPTGRIIFSKAEASDDNRVALAIFSCNPDGSDVRQVTFNPYAYSALSVLKDGRLLAVCKGLDSEMDRAVYMVIRPDGTKNQLFYRGAEGSSISTRAWETYNGKLVFIESDDSNGGSGSLVSITYNRPLHSFTDLSSGIKGGFNSVFPLKSGKYVVAYRKPDTEMHLIYEFDPENRTIGEALCGSNDYDITDVVAIERHTRARKLPSEVDMGVKTGLLLCQDINFSEYNGSGKNDLKKVSYIRIAGKDSTLGEFDAEKDGSFYLKVKSDTPFQIQKIDENGNVIGKSCEWLYLRPNERRGCVGCHEDPEQVPENRIPLAVKKQPVGIPGLVHKLKEKQVELE